VCENLTVSDLQTIAKVLDDLAEHHRGILRRLDNSRVLNGATLAEGSLRNLSLMNLYGSIANRVRSEILEHELV
jgi:hypothetical protein